VNPFIDTILSDDPTVRHRSFEVLCAGMAPDVLREACEELERFRNSSTNLYERVRACLFLYAAHRFHLQEAAAWAASGTISYDGYQDILERRFEEAIARFRAAVADEGPSGALMSALAEAYRHLAFQTLCDQVRRSVRASLGNRWMFRVGHAEDHPVRMRRECEQRVQQQNAARKPRHRPIEQHRRENQQAAQRDRLKYVDEVDQAGVPPHAAVKPKKMRHRELA